MNRQSAADGRPTSRLGDAMASPNVIELTADNWNEHVTSGTLVVADFWAPWCGPCRQLSPIVDRLADQFAGKVKVGKLNVDENPSIAVKYDVMTIPRVLSGGLVVRNGKQRGARLPLRHPVTVIGSAAGCDVRLTAEGVGPVHCAIVFTPTGLVLRSWHPDDTHVNGDPRADAQLVEADELKVGPCLFTLMLEDAAPPAPPEDALQAEASQLADLLDDRQRQVVGHEEQLAAARAALRRDREKLESDRAEADRPTRAAKERHRDATRERARARGVVARFVR